MRHVVRYGGRAHNGWIELAGWSFLLVGSSVTCPIFFYGIVPSLAKRGMGSFITDGWDRVVAVLIFYDFFACVLWWTAIFFAPMVAFSMRTRRVCHRPPNRQPREAMRRLPSREHAPCLSWSPARSVMAQPPLIPNFMAGLRPDGWAWWHGVLGSVVLLSSYGLAICGFVLLFDVALRERNVTTFSHGVLQDAQLYWSGPLVGLYLALLIPASQLHVATTFHMVFRAANGGGLLRAIKEREESVIV